MSLNLISSLKVYRLNMTRHVYVCVLVSMFDTNALVICSYREQIF